MPDRVRRVAALVKQNVASILITDAPRAQMRWITITDCVMTRDLKVAKLYYTSIERNLTHQEAGKILSEDKAEIRRRLAKRIVLKYLPDLSFVWDRSVLIEEKLREIKDGKP
ncbi:hypothetical protein GF359_00675 [candidate division WOR-3 bacterium]|uniref:Ribosome-binding factor A n=1 Tax=candidate division WOR-3 bacterium TaxID=2052148 RepID=A0A9D5K7J1_UNCW3|nr:hypothetical protein [candidate division WOR-3 bacterium]MBD3363707.1 hypothetical protein [candidate division WOR-3 bacterium]